MVRRSAVIYGPRIDASTGGSGGPGEQPEVVRKQWGEFELFFGLRRKSKDSPPRIVGDMLGWEVHGRKMSWAKTSVAIAVVTIFSGYGESGERTFLEASAHKSMNIEERVIVARRVQQPLNAEGFPGEQEWKKAQAIRFDTDWQGRNADVDRETEVRVLWSPETLFLQYRAKYKTITVFPDSEANGRRDKLWDRDVVEAFLQPDPSQLREYKEFEFSPNNMWIDLDIASGVGRDLKSGLTRRVTVDEKGKTWEAVAALPMQSLVATFNSKVIWRANFYRIEGAEEPRFYSAWSATMTEKPSFHVPEKFGYLRFE